MENFFEHINHSILLPRSTLINEFNITFTEDQLKEYLEKIISTFSEKFDDKVMFVTLFIKNNIINKQIKFQSNRNYLPQQKQFQENQSISPYNFEKESFFLCKLILVDPFFASAVTCFLNTCFIDRNYNKFKYQSQKKLSIFFFTLFNQCQCTFILFYFALNILNTFNKNKYDFITLYFLYQVYKSQPTVISNNSIFNENIKKILLETFLIFEDEKSEKYKKLVQEITTTKIDEEDPDRIIKYHIDREHHKKNTKK